MDVKLLPVASPQAKSAPSPDDRAKWKRSHEGLVGLVNIGNSCYMNAAIQALSNCPTFRQFFVECYHPIPSSSGHTSSNQRVADVMTALFKKMWASDKPPGHLSPRVVSSAMQNKMFRSSLQQDSQEFLRCLLMQIHDETAVEVPAWAGTVSRSHDQSHDTPGSSYRGSMISSTSHDSELFAASGDQSSSLGHLSADGKGGSTKTSPLPKKKVLGRLSLKHKPVGSNQSLTQGSPTNHRRFALRGSSSKVRNGSKGSDESISRGPHQPLNEGGSQISLESQNSEDDAAANQRKVHGDHDVYQVDMHTHKLTLHRNCHIFDCSQLGREEEEGSTREHGDARCSPRKCNDEQSTLNTSETEMRNGARKTSLQDKHSTSRPNAVKRAGQPKLCSIVTEVFEGILESRVKCGACKKVSVVHEPFQDLSLPIPGRKEMAKSHRRTEGESTDPKDSPTSGKSSGTLSRGFCTVINLVSQVRDMFSGPPTIIQDCLDAFFDPSELKGGNQYYCTQCKKFQNSQKEMSIIKLPEVLCIHLKRFRFDAYFSSKISRHIAFPIHSLDMHSYVKDSATNLDCSNNYELCAVITHYGGAGGGHYVAFARNSSHNSWFEFNDTHVRPVTPDTVINAEGYVLFYKRVPPANSVSLQNVELSSLLLPRPGGPQDAPNPVVYLSRHWLHLLRTCSTPGPIFQHEYACEHGAVLPNRSEHARALAMAVRRDVWDSYQQRFGGGPMVPKLEVCSTCKALLDNYSDRRKKEKDDVYKLQSMGHGQVEKKETFLLSQLWLKQWQSFIHCTTLAVGPPGPVDNSDLIQEVQPVSGTPQFRLVHDARALQGRVWDQTITRPSATSQPSSTGAAAYHKLSWATWSYMIKTYGGGPVVTSSMSPPPT